MLELHWYVWHSLATVGRSATAAPPVPIALTTYCGVDQDEHHGFADQTSEARVIFVGQHIVEVAREDADLVNDKLL